MTHRRAFTLVELMVVIAVIVILMAILLPTLLGARTKARSASCLSNLHQIGVALTAYTQDYDERLPPVDDDPSTATAAAGKPRSWLVAMQGALKSEAVARCPDDESTNWLKPLPGQTQRRRSSYAANGNLSERLGYSSLARIQSPSETIYLVESVDFATRPYVRPMLWPRPGYKGEPVRPGSEVALERHQEGSNYVFVDGHVKWHKFDQVYAPPARNLFDPAAVTPMSEE